MNREEAIKNLEMIRVAFVEPVTKEQRKLIDDTFYMAIKALEQEPCDDCVSRQAVIEQIKANYLASEDIISLANGLEDSVKTLPSVYPQNTDVLDEIRAEIKDIMSSLIIQSIANGTPLAESDDCVSRKAIEEIKEIMTDINGDAVYVARMTDIRKLPSVQPKRDKGEWHKGEWYIYQDYWYECSKCGCLRYMPTFTENYCPNCGADMRTESEEI